MARSRLPRQNSDRPLRFDQRLILSQWMLSLFDVARFEQLTEGLKNPDLEGFHEDNVSRFHRALCARLFDRPELPFDVLLGYDQNIVRHWKAISDRRNRQGHSLFPKYFQYFCLLFTEIYMDQYFRDAEHLLDDLNARVEAFNAGEVEAFQGNGLFPSGVPKISQVEPYVKEDLNKLAFWSATGSGKTLMMHVNILQYRHYLAQHKREGELNRVILLTPNEGLSHQHLGEFQLSGMDAELFSKEGRGLFSGRSIEIIDIHKLREQSGEKTVAVEAFEGNNLVMVDEGHRGTSGAEAGQWMQTRNQLSEDGFSFEYSATFGQAMKASGNKTLEQQYAKCILFDYSYKYFYRDGYGKDYRILNLEDDSDEEVRKRYLTASLLAFYQQQRLYDDGEKEFQRFLIERPLWVFVGGSVNAVRTENKRKVSDVIDILLFLAGFVADRQESVAMLDRFMRGQCGLLDARGNDLFANAFRYLQKLRVTPEQLYDDILHVLFNAKSPAALHVENLKGTDGEIALRLGENDPFGLINVGDAPSLCKLCEEHPDLVVTDRDFSGSLFRGLNHDDSSVNVLIGSKKFTEGWSSWRVSTMGLMNIGRSEGPQIIQLFGRGVRLKGLDFCLKRSRHILGARAPDHIDLLETLGIFGIRADYMRQFKEYLEEEGLPANEDRIEFILPVIKNLGQKKLKTIRVKQGVDFKRNGPRPTLSAPAEDVNRYRVVVDWYPKIQALSSERQRAAAAAERHAGMFTDRHIAFMDMDEVYFELQRFKNERAWHNLNLSREGVASLLTQSDWYTLYVPPEEMECHAFVQVRRWQEIALALLKKYCDRYYNQEKARFESGHLEYADLAEDDPNFVNEFRLLIDKSREEIVAALEEIRGIIQSGQLKEAEFNRLEFELSGIRSIAFMKHLYQPLLYVNNDLLDIRPVVLENQGERDFVLDLQRFCRDHRGFFDRRELYLLRNMSRGRGIGFFEAGNFYPDFVLWMLDGQRQHVSFVDPKGLRNIDGPEDPKIKFHETIKELERDLGDPNVVLNSFIVSSTPSPEVAWWGSGMKKADFERCHVFFQQEDRDTYIQKMLDRLGAQDIQPGIQKPAQESVAMGKAVLYIGLLLETWGKAISRDEIEAGLIFMLNDPIRRTVLRGISPRRAGATTRREFVVGMDAFLSNLRAHKAISMGQDAQGTTIAVGRSPIATASAPTTDRDRAKEAIEAVTALGQSRAWTYFAEVLDGEYALR